VQLQSPDRFPAVALGDLIPHIIRAHNAENVALSLVRRTRPRPSLQDTAQKPWSDLERREARAETTSATLTYGAHG